MIRQQDVARTDYAAIDARLDVERGLRFLTSRERRILIMQFAEDLPIGEIARRLGVSSTRARQLERRAMTKVRKALCRGDHAA